MEFAALGAEDRWAGVKKAIRPWLKVKVVVGGGIVFTLVFVV